ALHGMSPSAEGSLLPTSRDKDDKRALVPTALIAPPNIRRLATQQLCRSAAHGLSCAAARRKASRENEARKRRAKRTAVCRLRRRVGPPCCPDIEAFSHRVWPSTGYFTLIVAVALARRGASASRPAEGRCGARVPRRCGNNPLKENFGLPCASAS